ncbi:MAG: Do family serine endopeptidase [Alphaproteobacteria bacterium]|nr:MAG: Do family serine endopeptidase [Alphaproteobacteria bacterium]
MMAVRAFPRAGTEPWSDIRARPVRALCHPGGTTIFQSPFSRTVHDGWAPGGETKVTRRDLVRLNSSVQRSGQPLFRPVLNVFLGAILVAMALVAAPGDGVAKPVYLPSSFADLAEQVLPSVVNITVTKEVPRTGGGLEDFLRRFDPRAPEQRERPLPPRRRSGGGTGFVVDAKGLIVTNNHVVEDADKITVQFQEGEEYDAELVGTDPATDLAVIRIDPKHKLTALKFGDSDKARVGDWVITIGNPFGLSGTVTAGIISARNRNIQTGLYDDFIQTDSSINPGNSGGPMFNLDGEVIGINTAIFSPSGGNDGIGFSIPSNLAKTVITQLIEKGEVKRGWLGVAFQPVTRETAESLGLDEARGALVSSVTADGPAEKAGIRSGDIIIEYDGKEVNARQRLPGMVANTPIGSKVEVVVLRKGKRKTFTVQIAERDEDKIQASLGGQAPGDRDEVSVLAMTLGSLTTEVRESLGIDEDVEGAVILHVEPGSHAQEQGLRRGDVIVSVSLEDVKNPEEVVARVEEVRKEGRPSALFRIYRGGNYFHVTISFDD